MPDENLSMKLGGDQEVPPLAEELLAIEGFLEGEIPFSLGESAPG